MLIKVESECPECEATIQLTVSAGERGKTVGSVTSCSACGARLVTQTEDAVRSHGSGRCVVGCAVVRGVSLTSGSVRSRSTASA